MRKDAKRSQPVPCEEGVTRGGEYVQCERPAIAHRIDTRDKSTYAVCVGHVRHPMVQLEK